MGARTIIIGFTLCFCIRASLAAVTVGTCRPSENKYTTISAAITAAPAGGVINVCPGTYAEQI